MLSVKKFFELTFEVIRIDAQLEEIRRIKTCIPHSALLQQREDSLNTKLDNVRKKLDKEFVPVELASIEQYVKIGMQQV